MQQFLQYIILIFFFFLLSFGRPHAHHQELNNCISGLWFYLRIVVITVHGYYHDTKMKPEAAAAVVERLMVGVRKPETC
jgi:hypothetical protein